MDTSGEKWKCKLYTDTHQFISSMYALKPPLKLPPEMAVCRYCPEDADMHAGLPTFVARPLQQSDIAGWKGFLTWIYQYKKVAYVRLNDGSDIYILPPPHRPSHFEAATIAYRSTGIISKVIPRAAQMHPEYLTTLSQTHASWMFGALAELVDNARDAKAERLDISVTQGLLRDSKTEIPMLRFQDNGVGMDHEEILKMVSFGHKRPEADNPDLIGRFGVGFKTGAMRLGNDAIVFTQRHDTRSVALLSTSYNSGKDVLEVPVITYARHLGRMEIDIQTQSKEVAKASQKAITEFSPFDKYGIGSEFSRLGEGTGTLIYIFNLERRGSDYALNWSESDITIRSKRVRTRPGQTSQEVPLDYSLRAYLEVMFLKPHTIVYVQNKLVKTKQLAKTLNKTRVYTERLSGKTVVLTLGRSEAEMNRSNCGIFLYWHGRLIEAYKRVGNMVHSADWGRGVIGVVETTALMELGKGKVGVLNNKQGFEDSEEYAALEKWLGQQVDMYWEQVGERLHTEDYDGFPPDHDWVQCNKCLKWRVLPLNSGELPDEWFCYMPPYNGSCQHPEEMPEPGVVTVGTRRSSGGTAGKCVDAVAVKPIKATLKAVKPDPDRVKPTEPRFKRLKKSQGF